MYQGILRKKSVIQTFREQWCNMKKKSEQKANK
jgi:hypothetical protein